eukprot:jgi/Botrbrau1/1021/Bobra.114_1s0057.1
MMFSCTSACLRLGPHLFSAIMRSWDGGRTWHIHAPPGQLPAPGDILQLDYTTPLRNKFPDLCRVLRISGADTIVFSVLPSTDPSGPPTSQCTRVTPSSPRIQCLDEHGCSCCYIA